MASVGFTVNQCQPECYSIRSPLPLWGQDRRKGDKPPSAAWSQQSPCDLPVFGSPACHSIVLLLVLTWSPRGWTGSLCGVRSQLGLGVQFGSDGSLHIQLTLVPTWMPWQEAWVSPAGSSVSRRVGLFQIHIVEHPISMCEVPLSLTLQGSDLPMKDSLNFVCVCLDKHWRRSSCYIHLGEISELIYLVLWKLLLLSIYNQSSKINIQNFCWNGPEPATSAGTGPSRQPPPEQA